MKYKLCIVCLCFFSGMCNADEKMVFENIIQEIQNDTLSKIEVYALSPMTHTVSAMSPQQLEHSSLYKVEIKNAGIDIYKESLLSALLQEQIAERKGSVDIRWGVVFYGRMGERIGAVYVDRSGRDGYINDKMVRFSSKSIFFEGVGGWLSNNFRFR